MNPSARERRGSPRMGWLRWGAVLVIGAAIGCGGGAEKSPERPEGPTSPPSNGEPSPASSSGSAAKIDLPPGFPDSDEHRLDDESAPTPYTAEQIRAACPRGRINKWQVRSTGGDYVSVQNFVAVNEHGAKIQSLTLKADGTPARDTQEITATWRELQSHASYLAEETTISSERVKVPADEYDCWVYRVEENDSLTTYWFAKRLPGPPVKVEIHRGVERWLVMELIEVVLDPPRR